MSFKIIFEDQNFSVIEKPAGVIVNKADTTKNIKTLQDWVENEFKIKNLKFNNEEKEKYIIDGYSKLEEFFDRSGIVHRLDKETSGIILVAKNPETFINLQKQFKNGQVKKKYIALVHGTIETDGEIMEPIGRLPWNRKRFGIIPEGRYAKTNYKILKQYKDFTLLELTPITGRTHQIRVHLKHKGYPIFADELYAGRKTARNDRKVLDRHFLHACEITFLSPTTGVEVNFKSSLPEDLSNFLNTLNSNEN